jgi:ATP-dependent Zn protease
VTGFFSPPVAAVYADLGVPYRRGVLMYGPPGNGKTSLVRAIGASVPTIPGLILRPADDFDDRGLQNVLGQWQERAPAILVIEDLDWLFRQTRISVSAFLNALDGVGRRDGGLLLLATTNHPDALDPAINNRPGRFDVVVEVAPPDEPMRRQFLAGGRIGQLGDAVLDRTAADTDGLSFGHLRELETLSGLRAVAAGRTARSPADVADAVDLVVAGHRRAGDGFAPPPGSDFGLRPARSRRPRETAAVSEDDIPF